jgi:excinuclease UvrABC nuclease subunit
MNDIQTAITMQNFERAAQLRDMYRGIEHFCQKQSVVLSQQITCIVGTSVRIGNHLILCLLTIVDGKIIDIVRQSYGIDETSMSSLWVMVSTEYEQNFILYDNDKNIISD